MCHFYGERRQWEEGELVEVETLAPASSGCYSHPYHSHLHLFMATAFPDDTENNRRPTAEMFQGWFEGHHRVQGVDLASIFWRLF